MDIQPAQPNDLDDIRSLLRSCDLPYEDLTPSHLNHFVVVREESSLRGVVGLELCGDVALLRSLAVAPDARGTGLGSRLVDTVEAQARREGIEELYVLTTTAAGYFTSLGYEAIERAAMPPSIQETEEARCLCPDSATAMRKPIEAIETKP